MLYKEQDLEKFDKKVVLDCGYFKDERGTTTMLGMTPYYDTGEGFYGDFKEEKEGISYYKEKSNPFETSEDVLMFLRELYAKSIKNGYPIFARFGDDFFFVNEFNYNKPDKKVGKKIRELKKLMNKNIREDNLVTAEAFLYKLTLKK